MKNRQETEWPKITITPSGEGYVDLGDVVPSLMAPPREDNEPLTQPESRIITPVWGKQYVDMGDVVPSLMAPTIQEKED